MQQALESETEIVSMALGSHPFIYSIRMIQLSVYFRLEFIGFTTTKHKSGGLIHKEEWNTSEIIVRISNVESYPFTYAFLFVTIVELSDVRRVKDNHIMWKTSI